MDLSQVATQSFSTLPVTLRRHIFANVNSAVLQKLYQTCKFFYLTYQIDLIEEIQVEIDKSIVKTEGRTSIEFNVKNLENIWITRKLKLVGSDLSKTVLSKIIKCDASILILINCDLTMTDFKMLTSSGDVEKIELWGKVRKEADQTFVPLEDLLGKLPNATNVFLCPCIITPTTFQTLVSHQRSKPYHEFRLLNIQGTMDPYSLSEYLKNNSSKYCTSLLHIVSQDYQAFDREFAKELDTWETRGNRPSTCYSS